MTRALHLTLLLTTLTTVAIAQTNRGAIAGTVTDPQGSAIAGATVIVTNTGTNQSAKVKTSPTGSMPRRISYVTLSLE